MKPIPTAEEVLRSIISSCGMESYEVKEFNPELWDEMINEIKNFTKIHVKAAIQECIESAPSGSSTDTVSYEDIFEALKDCYPDENIR